MAGTKSFAAAGVRLAYANGVPAPAAATRVHLLVSSVGAVTAVADADPTPMTCYCACPAPYDDTYSVWLAVFTAPICATDKPMHAHNLPFPLFLPLYPAKDLVVLAFAAVRMDGRTPLPVYLAWPAAANVQVKGFLDLTVAAWQDGMVAWRSAVTSLSIGSWLSYAFDSDMETGGGATADEDLFLEDPVVCDAPVAGAGAAVPRLHVVSTLGSKARPAAVSAADEEEEEAEEGEFVSYPLMHTGTGDTSSESEDIVSESGEDKEEGDNTEEEEGIDDDVAE